MNVREEESSGAPALVAQLVELKSILEQELEAIRQRDAAKLAELTANKQALVDKLAGTANAMGDTLRTLLEEDDAPLARRVRELMTECANANKTNGCVIESTQSFTTSLLDVLRGRIPGERTYTARGRLGDSRVSNAFVSV